MEDEEWRDVEKAHMKLITSSKEVLRLSKHWDHKIPSDIFHLTIRTSEAIYLEAKGLFLGKVHQYIKDRLLDPKYACAFLFGITGCRLSEFKECPLKKMTGIPSYGFLIITTMKLCFPCSRELMPRNILSVGTTLVQNCEKMTSMLDVHALFHDYVPNPVLVIIDVQPKELGIPTKAYYSVEEVKENATQKSQKVFVHVQSEIAAHEVEEIGVEHLLRDVKDTTISPLATEVTGKLAALKGLDARLREIRGYLDLVIDGKLPLNHEILYHLHVKKLVFFYCTV